MKQIFTFLMLLIVLLPGIVKAQFNYSFSATTAPYGPVVGGTTPTLLNRPSGFSPGNIAASYATGFVNGIPIGFTLNHNGVDYTNINVSANGFATLGSPFLKYISQVQSFYINTLKLGPLYYVYGPTDSIPEGGNPKTVLAPLWDDISAGANIDLRYTTTGVAGSRIFTFEWANEKGQYDATPTLSFQLKLYEGTNGVQYCYKDEGGSPSAGASASIGIIARNQIGGGFMSLQNTSTSSTISSSVETSTLFKKPANNQVYRFTPLPCKLPLNLHYTSYNNTSVNFAWDAPLGFTNFKYAVTTSLEAPSLSTATSLFAGNAFSLLPDTKYYMQVRSCCSASAQSAWLPKSFVTTKNTSIPPAITWKKSIGGTGYDWATSIELTSYGGYIVTGSSSSNDGDVTNSKGQEDFLITTVRLTS